MAKSSPRPFLSGPAANAQCSIDLRARAVWQDRGLARQSSPWSKLINARLAIREPVILTGTQPGFWRDERCVADLLAASSADVGHRRHTAVRQPRSGSSLRLARWMTGRCAMAAFSMMLAGLVLLYLVR